MVDHGAIRETPPPNDSPEGSAHGSVEGAIGQWLVSAEAVGEDLAARAVYDQTLVYLFGRPRKRDVRKIIARLTDLLESAHQDAATDNGPRSIPAAVHYTLSRIASWLDSNDGPKSKASLSALVLFESTHDVSFGYVGGAEPAITVDGELADVEWVVVTDPRSREARAFSLYARAGLDLVLDWCPGGPSSPFAGKSVFARWQAMEPGAVSERHLRLYESGSQTSAEPIEAPISKEAIEAPIAETPARPAPPDLKVLLGTPPSLEVAEPASDDPFAPTYGMTGQADDGEASGDPWASALPEGAAEVSATDAPPEADPSASDLESITKTTGFFKWLDHIVADKGQTPGAESAESAPARGDVVAPPVAVTPPAPPSPVAPAAPSAPPERPMYVDSTSIAIAAQGRAESGAGHANPSDARQAPVSASHAAPPYVPPASTPQASAAPPAFHTPSVPASPPRAAAPSPAVPVVPHPAVPHSPSTAPPVARAETIASPRETNDAVSRGSIAETPASAAKHARTARRPDWPAATAPPTSDGPSPLKIVVPVAVVLVALFLGGWLLGRSSDSSNATSSSPIVHALRSVGLAAPRIDCVVESKPPGAAIEVDGKKTGRVTPSTIEVKPGQHNVTLSMPDLGSATFPVNGERGKKASIKADLNGTLSVRSSDFGRAIRVSVDGVDRGQAPLTLRDLAPGAHEVRFSSKGVPPWGQTVSIGIREDGEVLARPFESPATGLIEVRAQLTDDSGIQDVNGAGVWIDGKRRGGTPLTLELSSGPHSIRVSYKDEQAPVQVIDLPGGNQRFASFNFGTGTDAPRLSLIGSVVSMPRDRPSIVSVSLDQLKADDVREIWLHVRAPDNAWRRYPMSELEAPGSVVGVAVFPIALLDAKGRAPFYVSANTNVGDEYFTELQNVGAGDGDSEP